VSTRHLPVRPNLEQLKHQASDLLRAIRRGDADALAELRAAHRRPVDPARVRLAHAQHALARSYGVASWPRLVLACRMTDAICRDDLETVRALVLRHPRLLHEDARGVKGNWGPPMSYAANLGRDRLIAALRDLGADDVQFAFDRACLQGQIETATLLLGMGATPARDSVMGPCETLNAEGLAFLLDLGAELSDGHGNRLAPVGLVFETYGRNPAGKHRCLEILSRHGIELPDTPTMAVHRGRIDLLAQHVRRDAGVLSRTFAHEEIYPPALGCSADQTLALHGTPLAGATLLHMCVDFDEPAIARWLLGQGAPVDGGAAVDADGFGGHTALFGCVVTQPIRLRRSDEFARLLLEHGADPNARASLRKQLRGVEDETLHEYRDVTPLAWGERFHDQSFVSRPAMRLIAERGGRV
jgi:ankyrin repeat protein